MRNDALLTLPCLHPWLPPAFIPGCHLALLPPHNPSLLSSCPVLSQSAFLRLFKNYGSAVLNENSAIRMVLPDGSEAFIGNKDAKPGDLATVRVRDGELFSKVVLRSDIGLGEAYMDGAFVADDLYHMIEVISRNSCEPAASSPIQIPTACPSDTKLAVESEPPKPAWPSSKSISLPPSVLSFREVRAYFHPAWVLSHR